MAEFSPLAGFGFAGYRSFREDEVQHLGPMSKVHLVAGPNNSGKSNVLGIARRGLTALRSGDDPPFREIDIPIDRDVREIPLFRMALAVDEDAELPKAPWSLADLFKGGSFRPADDGLLWFEFESQIVPGRRSTWSPSRAQIADFRAAAKEQRGSDLLAGLSMHFTQAAGDDDTNANNILASVVDRLQLKQSIPSVATIRAVREIVPAAEGQDVIEDEVDGTGLIERLQRLQSPGVADLADRERFEAINRFIRILFDDESASIAIPYQLDTVLITMDGRTLPLDHFGMGVHEVVILAAAATVLSGHLVCIEEPEIHLHPTLQRKLLDYLAGETDNQYLIATHSAHLLDAARASITAIRLRENYSRLSPVVTPDEVAAIGSELGFRASDLVQSNAVIWVEGPSDRVYLSHWIRLLEPELREGIHYSIMFYGGALLRHLTAEDPAVVHFISLPRINRNFLVVIDSDRKAATDNINQTKQRVKQELEQGPDSVGVWITAGYTIEDYVPPEMLRDAVAAVHSAASCSWKGDQFVNPLDSKLISGRKSDVDKTAVALHVVKQWTRTAPQEWPHDLRDQIGKVVAMVRAANA